MLETAIGTDIERAVFLIRSGELVSVPTETVYGLAANGFDPFAVAKIYTVKNRPQFNPLILHVANVEQMKHLVSEMPEACLKLVTQFSPGPITYLLPKSSNVPEIVTAGSSKVAIRIPDHPLALKLLNLLNLPLAAPSANPSGYVSPVSANHVMQGLGGKISYILDGGSCRVGLESTIVGFEDSKVIVHRLGAITAEQIASISDMQVEIRLSHAAPTAPGQLKSHYATSKPLFIGEISEMVSNFKGKKIGVLCLKDQFDIKISEKIVLSKSGSLEEAAANLFNAMRTLDRMDIDVILTERFPDIGIGMAINDRLERAAYRG